MAPPSLLPLWYCFMAIVKAYELAGYDISKINEYELHFGKLMELLNTTINFLALNGRIDAVVETMGLDDNETRSKKEVLKWLADLKDREGFPGFEDSHALRSWIETQPYKDRSLLVSLFYYTGEEIVNGQGVKLIEPEAVTPPSEPPAQKASE